MTKSRIDREMGDHYTLKDIERGIRNREQLYTFAEDGNLDTVHLIVDAEKALDLAKPTLKQLKTAYYYWGEGLTLKETGDRLDVTPQAVKFNLELLKVKIKSVLDRWEKGIVIK